MIKGKEIYPKTRRIKVNGYKIQLTEKLDGSNLTFFKKDGELYIAQRKNIYTLSEIDNDDVKNIMYKGLYEWLRSFGKTLYEKLRETSCICGEWLGMGNIKYDVGDFPYRWYMFAKANVDENLNLYNLYYDHDLFIYPFEDMIIPDFIGIVPVAYDISVLPTKDYLDSLYDKYCQKVKGRTVEGFVINDNNNICKYVRIKSGKLVDYSDTDHKGE